MREKKRERKRERMRMRMSSHLLCGAVSFAVTLELVNMENSTRTAGGRGRFALNTTRTPDIVFAHSPMSVSGDLAMRSRVVKGVCQTENGHPLPTNDQWVTKERKEL